MSNFVVMILLACLVAGSGCSRQSDDAATARAVTQKPAPAPAPEPLPELVLRYHFAGLTNVLAATNSATLRAFGDLPAALATRQQLWPKLARAFSTGIGGTTNFPDPATMELLRPLLDDWLAGESWGEVQTRGSNTTEWAFAIQADPERGSLWSTNLWQSLDSLQLAPAKVSDVGGFPGWESKSRSGLVRFATTGNWVVIGSGNASNAPLAKVLAELKAGGRPTPPNAEQWFALSANLEALGRLTGWTDGGQWPGLELAVAPRNQRVRVTGRLHSKDPLVTTNLPAWQIPTNSIHDDPLISFTVLRGLAPLAAQSSAVRSAKLDPFPGQFVFWGLDSAMPILSYFACTTEQPTNTLMQVAEALPGLRLRGGLTNRHHGQVLWATNQSGLVWDGLMTVLPFVKPLVEPAGSFITGGLFKLFPSTNDMPAELLRQVTEGTNTLVYYDWEFTRQRATQWLQLSQMFGFLKTPYMSLPTNLTARAWVAQMAPELEESVTQMTAESPRELAFTRSAKTGLNSLELAVLAQWLDEPEFPFVVPSLFYRPIGAKLLDTESVLPGGLAPPVPR